MSISPDIEDLFETNFENVNNPNPAPTDFGAVLYNAATGNLTSGQIKDTCQDVYNANLQASGGDKAKAQAAYNECAHVAAQGAGGTGWLPWVLAAAGAILLIEIL